MRIVVLDSEAVDALADVASSKHRRALAYIEAGRGPRRRRVADARFVVPDTVRVEAGWDRTSPGAAFINRLGIEDHHLNGATTNVAARLRRQHAVSPADAHIGAVVAQRSGEAITVITSDPHDVATVAEANPVTIITL